MTIRDKNPYLSSPTNIKAEVKKIVFISSNLLKNSENVKDLSVQASYQHVTLQK